MANLGLFTNCGIFCGGYNLTGRSNAINGVLTKEIRDRSYFGAGNGRIKGTGLQSAVFTAAGYYDSSVDIERDYHGTDTPVTIIIPTTAGAAPAAGDRAFFMKALEAEYKRGGAFGDDAMFSFAALGDQLGYPVGVGYCLNPGLVPVTADNDPAASIKELGAVAAGQYLYAVLHVTSVSTDDSIIVKVESDALETFLTPTAQITFASKNAIGSEYAVRVAGPITDTWWRAYADVTGADVSITFACAMAII